MWRSVVRAGSVRPPKAERQAVPNSRRDRLAALLALVTLACLGWVFVLARDTQFLMPGPLASAHGAIEKCSTCHTKSGSGNLSWTHGLIAGDPLADGKACLTCHKMPDTAFNAHGASAEVLKQSTERLTKIAATTPAPLSARAQNAAFPTDHMAARGITCATCHQEHQGASFKLSKISNEQCRSCHVVKFDSFDGGHPKFENYPFKRRTRLIYDHASHFGKHFPEVAKKDPARRIPATCSTCHSSGQDKRVMAVAPFEQTCTSCHLDQITGKERVSGPKGVAFLSVPGLDLGTLRKKKAAIGEWPEASEAELTPFMKMMISRDARGRALIKTVDRLNLQDLSRASDAQIRAVTSLVWEIKGLFHALIKGKASDVLADLGFGGGVKLSANLVADLTAHLPRDVVIRAHQQWLPNLDAEMANRPQQRPGARPDQRPDQRQDTSQQEGGWTTTVAGSRLPVDSETAGAGNDSPSAQVDQQADQQTETEPKQAIRKADAADAKDDGGRTTPPADERPRPKAADQTDDLLNLTAEELRGIAAPPGDAKKSAQPKSADAAARADANPPAGAPPASDTAAARPQAKAAPVISIESEVEPESWAAYGGWYRQDYAIFYRPTGHKDKLIYSWLFLTGPQAPKGDRGPAAAVFASLTGKDAQGSCTKCHSVDDIQGKGRVVNFPPSAKRNEGRFTQFIHEPHFAILENRGCLTCHNLEKGRPYLKSYEQGNPQSFVSNFGAVNKDLCQTCHTSSMARQDCLTCHKYHVNGVVTPIMDTKVPLE